MSGEPERERSAPMRMCVGCRTMKLKSELVRVVKSPEGEILLDETGKKNGRGAYICRNEACFQLALKRRAFERAFKAKLPENVSARIESELAHG